MYKPPQKEDLSEKGTGVDHVDEKVSVRGTPSKTVDDDSEGITVEEAMRKTELVSETVVVSTGQRID